MKLQEQAQAFAALFETATRSQEAGGGDYIRLQDGAPDWATDIVRKAAHDGGEMLPNDWSYRIARACADSIVEALADGEDVDDNCERVDGLVSVYTSDRLSWLASHAYRASYCDEAAADMGGGGDAGIVDRIAWGMVREYQAVWSGIVQELRELADDDDDGDDDREACEFCGGLDHGARDCTADSNQEA